MVINEWIMQGSYDDKKKRKQSHTTPLVRDAQNQVP